ncbi:MAG: GNAT family N-acetyltransferase [Phycicoccus sp.]
MAASGPTAREPRRPSGGDRIVAAGWAPRVDPTGVRAATGSLRGIRPGRRVNADDGPHLAVRALAAPAEVVAATGAHPLAVLDLGDGERPRGFAVGADLGTGAVVVARPSDHGVPGIALLGDGTAYDTLLRDERVRAWLRHGAFRHVSAPRGTFDAVRPHVVLDPDRNGDWDWMWTRTPPPDLASEQQVQLLEPHTRDELVAFLRTASPRTHGQPFARAAQVWVGIRTDRGRLVACGGSEASEAGTPVLAGIAVDPACRGKGLGAAVTTSLTRRAVADAGACALGVFADNVVARRLYHRLGYTTGMEWHSGWLAEPTAPRRA